MEALILEGTEDTPKVILDRGEGIYEISGRSFPENAPEFYRPILEWIDRYADDPEQEMVFVFRLEYFNTATSKLILDILMALEDVDGVKIMWYFDEEDEDMEEAGEEFSELVEIPFEFKTY